MKIIPILLLLLISVAELPVWAAAPHLEVQTQGDITAEADRFNPGVLLFSDRQFKLALPPDSLKGQEFLRTTIRGIKVRCSKPGTITALTPPIVPSATSASEVLLSVGFHQVPELKKIQLFGTNAHEQVQVYRKNLELGEKLKLPKWCILLGFEEVEIRKYVPEPWPQNSGEKLYNGIVLPAEWPPETINTQSENPMPVPYLEHPPRVIPIDVGRQLFVDDFLIERTDLLRTCHLPEKYTGNPVLKCETALERQKDITGSTGRPCIWWDHKEQHFKMWYQAGTYFQGTIALAISKDGIHWTRPTLDVKPGSNQALPLGFQPDSYSIVPDWQAEDPRKRFMLFATNPGGTQPASSFTSADGIHWINKTLTGPTADRSSMFYNPFRKKWIYSLRSAYRGRSRHYWESSDFLAGAGWNSFGPVPWLTADCLDAPEAGYNHKTQLYNFDAVAYESIMLGFFELHRGPPNGHCERMGLTKLNEISFGYSRDGFHWARPDRRAHIPASRKDTWDRGFVESGGNICAIIGDKLLFYHSGCQGDMNAAIREDGSLNKGSMYDRNSIGFSTLRRDGFASLNAGASTGSVTTRVLQFSGEHLFVNIDAPEGEFKAEILDEKSKPIEPFTMANYVSASGDKTLTQISWNGVADLSSLKGKSVRFRFSLRRGALYAFWVSQDESGRSDGYVAGGGPGYKGLTDTIGNN